MNNFYNKFHSGHLNIFFSLHIEQLVFGKCRGDIDQGLLVETMQQRTVRGRQSTKKNKGLRRKLLRIFYCQCRIVLSQVYDISSTRYGGVYQ